LSIQKKSINFASSNYKNNTTMDELKELFTEYETDNLSVGDFGITTQGALVTNVINNKGKVEFWSGDPTTQKYAEELMLSKYEKDRIIEEICNLM